MGGAAWADRNFAYLSMQLLVTTAERATGLVGVLAQASSSCVIGSSEEFQYIILTGAWTHLARECDSPFLWAAKKNEKQLLYLPAHSCAQRDASAELNVALIFP